MLSKHICFWTSLSTDHDKDLALCLTKTIPLMGAGGLSMRRNIWECDFKAKISQGFTFSGYVEKVWKSSEWLRLCCTEKKIMHIQSSPHG